MKKRKLISFLLASALTLTALGVLSACNNSVTPPAPTPNVGGEGWYKDLNFNGAVLKIDQSINLWSTTDMIDNAAKFTMTPAEKGEDLVRNECYDRNTEVQALLGLNLNFRTTDLGTGDILDYYDPLIATNAAPDIIINDVYPVVPMSLNGQLMNVKTTNLSYGTNYFNMDADCWYEYFMSGLTLDNNKMYGIAGDYFMDVIRSAHCLYLNTDIFRSRATGPDSEFKTLEDFYDYVEDGKFTYDDLMSLTYLGWEDSGSMPGETDINDVVGYLTQQSGSGLFPYIYGSTASIVKGKYPNLSIETSNLQLVNLAEKLIAVCGNDGALHVMKDRNGTFRDKFVAGQVMILGTYWLGDLEFSKFKNMQDKAAIVYPKLTSTQRSYRTYIHDSAEIGYIPISSAANFSKASAFLQLVNEKSESVIDIYFNETLKYKDNTDFAAVAMLDVIYDSVDSSFNQFMLNQVATYGNAAMSIFEMIDLSVEKKQETVSQNYAANIDAYIYGLEQLIAKYNSMQ